MSVTERVDTPSINAAEWVWLVPYAVAILLTLLLAVILGTFPLFTSTFLAGAKLSAADVVGFLGYGGALLLFWLLGQRVAVQLEGSPSRFSFLRPLVMPLVMLIVLSLGYEVVLLLVGPFLGRSGKALYAWMFIGGLVAASVWLTLAWLWYAAPLVESLAGPTRRVLHTSCPRCNALLINAATYCGECGARLPRSVV